MGRHGLSLKEERGVPRAGHVQEPHPPEAHAASADARAHRPSQYGAKALALSKDGNAIFVQTISDVAPVLETLRAAVENGELDSAIEMTISRLINNRIVTSAT